MIKELPLDVVGSTKFGRYPKISSESTYNMVISDNALVAYSGYKNVLSFQNNGKSRAIFRSIPFNHLIIVIENKVFIVSTAIGFSQVGTLKTESGPVYIAENGIDQIVLVDETTNVYVYNHKNSTFSTVVTDGVNLKPLFRAIYVTFQDGYFIVADGFSNQFRLSKIDDGTIWPSDAPNIGVLQTDGDQPQAVVKFKRQLFIMGKTVTDIRHNVGNTLFPYQLDNSIAINYGVLSAETITADFDLLVWLAQNRKSGPTLVVSTGGQVKALANEEDGIQFFLNQLNNPEDSSAFLFQENGHIFYQITFRSDNVSLTYDFHTGKFYTLTDENLDAHIAQQAAFFNNKNYFIATNDTNLYEFSTNITTYDGKAIPRIRITSSFRDQSSERFIVPYINLTMESGLSTVEQKVLLSLSKDGANSFGNVFSKTLPNFGRRANRVRFFNLGSANDFTFKFQWWAGNASDDPISQPTGTLIQPNTTPTQRFTVIGATVGVLA